MREITFNDFCNHNKKTLQIYIYENEFKCSINECDFSKIDIDQYLRAISSDNLKLVIFKFYLPKTKTKYLKIFYAEEKNGYFENVKKRWQYKIMSKNEEALLEEDILAQKFCDILNDETENIRVNIKKFFIALGCDSDRIILNQAIQHSLKYNENYENKEVRTNES